jgi:hypothetical protein
MCAACTNNDCKDCIPPAKQCLDGMTSQVCGSDGHWTTTSCPNGCYGGDCGVCKPGTDVPRCNPMASNTPQVCTGGVWVDDPPCPSATPICSGGNCFECTDGQARCNANTSQLETCMSNHWLPGMVCPNGCNGDQCADPPTPDAGMTR